MLTMRELEAQAKALAPVLKGFVASAIAALRGDLEKSLVERITELRAEQQKAIESITVPTAEEVSALIPAPKDGLPGKDADPADVARLVLAELPPAEPGKSITVEDVRPLLEELVAAIPAPENGKDADPEDIKQLIAEAVAQLPQPRDGESVTVEDLAPVIAEQLAQAVAELPKPQDGQSVPLEDVQRMVAEEVAKAMQEIQPPQDGAPGRDAAQIEILPAIDLAKGYSRGTYAKHLGGLWRSYEATSGMRGWECIVEGIAALSIEQEGERGLKAVATLSSGATEEKTISIPAMIYRGVFAPGEYQPGDTATWAGSLWHCDEPTTDKPGEVGSKGWRLAVKKGRDGKDGRNGIDKTAAVRLP